MNYNEEMEKLLYERMRAERDQFVDSVKDGSAGDTILILDKIEIFDEILQIFGPRNTFGMEVIKDLLKLEHPLQELYEEFEIDFDRKEALIYEATLEAIDLVRLLHGMRKEE